MSSSKDQQKPEKVSISLKGMSPNEIIKKVESGKIDSYEYHSFTEYVKGMEK